MADRIKQMLPQITPGEPIFASDSTQKTFEVNDTGDRDEQDTLQQVQAWLDKGNVKDATELALKSVPFHRLLSVFTEKIVPALKISTNLSDDQSIPLYNLVLILQNMGHEALARQLLLELGVDGARILRDLQFAEMLQSVPPTLDDLEDFLYETTHEHFPQILYHENVSLWFRTMVLSRVSWGDQQYFQTTVQRFGHHFQYYNAMNLLLTTNPKALHVLSFYLLAANDGCSSVSPLCGLIDAALSPKQVQHLWGKLKKTELDSDIRISDHILRKAVSLNASYTITNIVHSTAALQRQSLLSKALTSVAWSQKRQEGLDDESLVTAWDVQYEQVTRFVNSLKDTKEANRVISNSVASLCDQSEDKVTGRVLWALLLGLDKSHLAENRAISPVLNRQLSRAVSRRPLLEQVRYMALDIVDPVGISFLLKYHMTKMIQHRRANRLPTLSLEEDRNVKLMLAGMIVMTEKMGPSFDHKDEIHLVRIVRDLFESWDPQVAAELLENLNHRYKPSREVAMATMGLLLRHGNVSMTVQLMREVGPDHLDPAHLHGLLIKVGRELPIVIVPLVSWLIRTRKVFVPPSVIRKLIVCLNKTAKLSYSQRFTRTTRLLSVLRGLGVGPGPVAAASMVDAMIKAAAESGRGSRRRLQWALDICQREGVPEAKVKQWLAKVMEMRTKGHGYWTK